MLPRISSIASPACRIPRTPMLAAFLVALASMTAMPSTAFGRARGIVTDSCVGCHGSDPGATLSLTASPANFNPGDTVTLTLTLKWASIRVGGTYITTGGVGTLQALSGEGLAVNGNGLTHSSPKAAANGVVTFRFGWKAPSMPGAVPFYVSALAGNGNNASSGDAGMYGLFQWVYGCTPRTLYADSDRDGYGGHLYDSLLACADGPVREGYAVVDGDCDENDEKVHPGLAEVCNGKDDNCDGQVDENAPAGMMWPDGDGDGYYKQQTGTPRFGCGNIPGFALLGGDCVDNDPAIHPGATEVCNGRDDNCNGSIDERVRPQCGVGWCRRESPSCRPEDCVPGQPTPEQCNLADDDCNGEVDDNACPAGLTCEVNQCVAGGSGATSGGTGGTATGGSPGSGGSRPDGGGTGGGSGGSNGSGGSGGSGGTTGTTSGSGGSSVTGSSQGGGCALVVAKTIGSREGDAREWLRQAGVALALLSLLSLRRRRPRS